MEMTMSGKAQMTGRLFALGLGAVIAGLALPAAAQNQQGQQCWTGNMPQFTKSVNDHKASQPTGSQNPYLQRAMHATSGCYGSTSTSGGDPRQIEAARIKAQQAAIDAQRRANIQRFLNNRRKVKVPVIKVPAANPQGPKNNLPMLAQKRTWQNHSSMGPQGQAPNQHPSHHGGYK
jgi:hypothetical protein